MGWNKRANFAVMINRYKSDYTQNDVEEIVSYFDELTSTAKYNADGSSDEKTISFAKFMAQANQEMHEIFDNINLGADKTVEDRRKSLNDILNYFSKFNKSYEDWKEPIQLRSYETMPGHTIAEKTAPFLGKINNEKSKLDTYETEQRAFFRRKQWESHLKEYKKNHPKAIYDVMINYMSANAGNFYNYVNSYMEEYSYYKKASQKETFALKRLSDAANAYKRSLDRIESNTDTEQGAISLFDGIRKMTSVIKSLDAQIKAIQDFDLPFGFKDKVFDMAKGQKGSGLYGDINRLLAYSNTLSDLLENGEPAVEGIDEQSIPYPDQNKLNAAKYSFRDNALGAIDKLGYAQNAKEGTQDPIDQEHLMGLIEGFGNFCATELPDKPGYQNTLDIENDVWLLSAQQLIQESGSIYPFDKEKLGAGTYYAKEAASRINQLVTIQENLRTYINAIFETHRSFTKADNSDMAKAVGNYGEKFTKYYNVIADDLKALSEIGLKSSLADKNASEFEKLTTHIDFETATVNFSKRMDEMEIADAEKEKQQILERQQREEQQRKDAEERRQIEKEIEQRELAKQQEADRKEEEKKQEELRKQESIRKEKELFEKEKKAATEKLNKEREERERREAREEKERQAIENQRKEIRGKYINLMSDKESGLEFAAKDQEHLVGYSGDVSLAYYSFENILPTDSEKAQEVMAALKAMNQKLLFSSHLNSEYFTHDSDKNPKDEFKKHSEQMELLMGLKDIIKKLEDIYPQLGDVGKKVVTNRGSELATLYHKAAKEGRTVYEKTLAIEAPGIGNIEVFKNEDPSVGEMFLSQVKKKQIIEESGAVPFDLYENAPDDNDIQIDNNNQIGNAEAPANNQIDNNQIGNADAPANNQIDNNAQIGNADAPANNDIQIEADAPDNNNIQVGNDIQINNVEVPEVQAPVDNDLKAFIISKVAQATRRAFTADDFDEIVYSGYVTYGNDATRNNLFMKREGINAMDSISEVIKGNGKVFINLPDMQTFTVDVTELKMTNAGPKLEIPNYEYTMMTRAVRDIAGRVNATGTTLRDSNEFKEFKNSINELASRELPKDKEEFYNSLNDLYLKALAYGVAKLDQNMNTRRDNRFTEASRFIETYGAICEHRKPSERNMNLNMIASKFVKVKYIEELKSKNPDVANKAREILSDNLKLGKEIISFAEKKAFRNLFANKSERELHDFAHKNAYDVKKDIIREIQQPQAQLNI